MHATPGHLQSSNAHGITVIETELAAATGDGSDCPQLESLVPVLNRMSRAFGMELVFVGELRDGMLSGRHAAPGDRGNPFEEAYASDLLRLRCGASAYAAVTVEAGDGLEAGTLVCDLPAEEADQGAPSSLRSVSRLLAGAMRRMQTDMALA